MQLVDQFERFRVLSFPVVDDNKQHLCVHRRTFAFGRCLLKPLNTNLLAVSMETQRQEDRVAQDAWDTGHDVVVNTNRCACIMKSRISLQDFLMQVMSRFRFPGCSHVGTFDGAFETCQCRIGSAFRVKRVDIAVVFLQDGVGGLDCLLY